MVKFYPALNASAVGHHVPVREYLHIGQRYGYRWAELNRTQAMQLAALGRKASLDLVQKTGVEPVAFFVPVEWRESEERFKDDLSELPSIAEIAVTVGARRGCTWLLPNYPTPPAESKKWISVRLRQIDVILADHGIRFGLEAVAPAHFLKDPGQTFIYGYQAMLAFAQELGSNTGLVIDSFHWYCFGDSEQSLAVLPAERIIYVHINDAPDVPRDEQRDDDRLIPGHGVIDLMAFLRGLDEAGYQGPIGLESYGPRLVHLSSEEAAKQTIEAWERLKEQYDSLPN